MIAGRGTWLFRTKVRSDRLGMSATTLRQKIAVCKYTAITRREGRKMRYGEQTGQHVRDVHGEILDSELDPPPRRQSGWRTMRVGVPDLGTGGPKAPRTARHKADEPGPAEAGQKEAPHHGRWALHAPRFWDANPGRRFCGDCSTLAQFMAHGKWKGRKLDGLSLSEGNSWRVRLNRQKKRPGGALSVAQGGES